jgi:hypothetical protein
MNNPTFHEVLWKVIKDGGISFELPLNFQTSKEFTEAYKNIANAFYTHV